MKKIQRERRNTVEDITKHGKNEKERERERVRKITGREKEKI